MSLTVGLRSGLELLVASQSLNETLAVRRCSSAPISRFSASDARVPTFQSGSGILSLSDQSSVNGGSLVSGDDVESLQVVELALLSLPAVPLLLLCTVFSSCSNRSLTVAAVLLCFRRGDSLAHTCALAPRNKSSLMRRYREVSAQW